MYKRCVKKEILIQPPGEPREPVDLSVIFIYKYCKKENLIQPSRKPRGQHLGEFQQRTSKLKFDMDSISLFIT